MLHIMCPDKLNNKNYYNTPFNIIHTADWHLGQRFYDYERTNEHEKFLEWLLDNINKRKTDLLVISGDIFDTSSPSSTSQELFYRFLFNLTKIGHKVEVIIIAGNHDGASRLEAPAALMKVLNITVIGSIKRKDGIIDLDNNIIKIKDENNNIRCIVVAIPYLRQGDYPINRDAKNIYSAGVAELYKSSFEKIYNQKELDNIPIVALGHFHSASASLSDSERGIRGGLEMIDSSLFDIGYDYIALGHIHKSQKIGGKDNVRYSGSPIPMSFSEINYRHKVIEIGFLNNESTIEELIIPRFVDIMRIGTPDKPLSKDFVLSELQKLPEIIEQENRDEFPFLEINIQLEVPDLLLSKQITDIIDNKKVRLASSRVYYKKDNSECSGIPQTIEDFKELSPEEMLQRVYIKKYGVDVPEDIRSIYAEIISELGKELK